VAHPCRTSLALPVRLLYDSDGRDVYPPRRSLRRGGTMRIAILAVVVLFGSIASMSGQTFGEITGEIRDSSGGVVASAAVTVTNQATGGVRAANTNQFGLYSFPSLPPGIYDLRVTAPGFQAITRRDVELQVQQTARIDFTLQVGEVTQTVEISGG